MHAPILEPAKADGSPAHRFPWLLGGKRLQDEKSFIARFAKALRRNGLPWLHNGLRVTHYTHAP
jgi:hypothetical protein